MSYVATSLSSPGSGEPEGGGNRTNWYGVAILALVGYGLWTAYKKFGTEEGRAAFNQRMRERALRAR